MRFLRVNNVDRESRELPLLNCRHLNKVQMEREVRLLTERLALCHISSVINDSEQVIKNAMIYWDEGNNKSLQQGLIRYALVSDIESEERQLLLKFSDSRNLQLYEVFESKIEFLLQTNDVDALPNLLKKLHVDHKAKLEGVIYD